MQKVQSYKQELARSNSLPSVEKSTSRRGRSTAIAIGDETHLTVLDLINKSMGQTFDKHERFEALRYLSNKRRGMSQRSSASGDVITSRKASLVALLNEGKAKTEDHDAEESDVFVTEPATPKQLSAVEVVALSRQAPRLSLV